MYEFDIIVIGSGSAGISAVEAAIDAGAEKVAVVEGVSRLGGECPNWACVPTKALLRSVEVLSVVRRVEDFGIKVSRPSFQFGKIMARKTRIVDALTKPPRLEGILKKLNVTVIKGWATFLNPLEIEVRGKRYRAQKFIIATGSEHVLPPVEGLKEISYLTSDDLMGIPRVPSSLLIVGGGPVGAECAQIFAPLGTKVTIVEFSPHLLSREEPEVAEVVERSLTRQGVAIFSSKKVLSVRMRRKQIAVTVASVNDETKQQEIIASHILVAAGKRPRVNRLGLEAIGVNMDKRGAPIVNEYLQTNIPSVYVAGDAAGHMLFTHVAHYEGEVAGKNAVVGNKQKIDLSVVPRGTFTTPEVGSVG
ncbi:MAG: NAD(P)/FAD-dependent oxidoreductase, partial [bacterium]|nr:NAD(P)/FAD-dependent oxidoreductase [bacterium]